MDTTATPRGLRDVGSDAAIIAGGGRAVLLQLANPAIGHAVARHSDFVAHPTARLKHTLAYVYALIYGTDAQVHAVRSAVNRAHRPVKSPGGAHPSYDATDPHLQLWVAATLYDTAMQLHQAVVSPLSEADLDAIYRDYSVIGTALQMPAELWPADRAAFAEYWNAQLEALSVDDTVRAVSRTLLHPTTGPLWLRAGMPLARLVTTGLLPPRLRAAYALPWTAARERRFDRAMATIRIVNRMLPRRVREWPKNYLLRRVS
ncbi:oxygenase MpaB family protein [Marisediminicola senii]|uniref:oxygenase MpaB family protein n=1 Tax=Marisediminicola senii TaxID=2711233 RepID=UPI0013EB74CF|nr:oxygenase MpaB family protein [Marisediminicola senii]